MSLQVRPSPGSLACSPELQSTVGGVSRRWLEQAGLTLGQGDLKGLTLSAVREAGLWGLKSSGDLYFFSSYSHFASYSFCREPSQNRSSPPVNAPPIPFTLSAVLAEGETLRH